MNAIETLKTDCAHFGVAPSILSADFLQKMQARALFMLMLWMVTLFLT